MRNKAASPPKDQLTLEVRKLFAEITDYPFYFLDPEAVLGDDLGIDDGAVGQVLVQLCQRFELADSLDLAPDTRVSISRIVDVLASSLGGSGNGGDKPMVTGGNGTNGAGVPAASSPTPSVGPAAAAGPSRTGSSNLAVEVREVFAEVTRYPLEILSFDALLEEELGIDSVKLGEVFSVLREHFDLPEERIGIPEEQLRTIGGIAEALEDHLGQPDAETAAAQTEVAEVGTAATAPAGDMVAEVREVFAEVTRYPLEILTPEAALEEDLGIDSVKLGEVFSVLGERFDLPEERIGIPEEQLRTIGGIAEALADYLGLSQAKPALDLSGVVAEAAPASLPAPAAATKQSDPVSSVLDSSFAALTPERKPFAGKVVFVSGSGRGLGKEIACYLAGLGAHVVINSFHSRQAGIETAEEIRSNGGEADHIWGSVANQEQLTAIFDEIEKDIGYLDFFVSNASNGMLAPLSDITVEHWEKAFRTNVVGLHQSALRAAALMRPRGGGKIITMSSPAAHGYVDYFGCMGAVKAAVESLTRSLAIEFAPQNIQVNCVSPGPVYGELLNKWPDSSRLIKKWEGNTAYERLCEARDVSHFIAYLLSEPVKLFTGSVLVMDGGISSLGW